VILETGHRVRFSDEPSLSDSDFIIAVHNKFKYWLSWGCSSDVRALALILSHNAILFQMLILTFPNTTRWHGRKRPRHLWPSTFPWQHGIYSMLRQSRERRVTMPESSLCQTISIAKPSKKFFEPISFEVDRARQRQVFCRCIVRSKSALKSCAKYLRLGNEYERISIFFLFLHSTSWNVWCRQVKCHQKDRACHDMLQWMVCDICLKTPSVKSK
jgi:hypothetical protein